MTRTTWILGNWKQNHLTADATTTAQGIAEGLTDAMKTVHSSAGDIRVGFAPTFVALAAAAPYTRPATPVWLLAQNSAAQQSGAFTGEVGPAMLADVGVDAVIIGHSERRSIYGETDATIATKVALALEQGLTVVLCIGEALEAREAGQHEATVIGQLTGSLARVQPAQLDERIVLAYEPVWAIGTGRTATPDQARDMHRVIRSWLKDTYGDVGADRSILYGGSVKPANAADLIAAGDVDGFLVGGASLDANSFLSIVRAAAQTARP